MERTVTYLLAAAALESIRLCLLLLGTKGMKEIILLYLIVCRSALFRSHFLSIDASGTTGSNRSMQKMRPYLARHLGKNGCSQLSTDNALA